MPDPAITFGPLRSSEPTPQPRGPHAGGAATARTAGVRGDAIARETPRAPSLRDVAQTGGNASAASDPARRSALVSALVAHVPAADRPAAKTAVPAILDAARRSGTTDPNRLGYLLATAQTESDFGANMTESGHSKAWFNATYGGEDGNRPGTSDGYEYRGRGYVQTTRAGRYAELSHSLGLPDVVSRDRGKATPEAALVAHPERLEQPELAARALVVGVTKNLFTHNPAAALDRTIPTGHKPGDADFYHARGIVNGIVKDQAAAIAEHATVYAQILAGYRQSVLGEKPR
ncbi:MAG: hypothetical protein ABSB70_14445 [Candidatus Velthaea sp.]